MYHQPRKSRTVSVDFGSQSGFQSILHCANLFLNSLDQPLDICIGLAVTHRAHFPHGLCLMASVSSNLVEQSFQRSFLVALHDDIGVSKELQESQ